MKRIACNIVALVMMAAFCLYLIVGNVLRISVPVITVPGSYAEEYAKQNHLKQANLPDSLSVGAELKYETFQYNVNGNHITIEKYDGEGTDIVIPYSIDGKLVTALGEDFFAFSPKLKKVYLSDIIDTIKASPTETVELVVASNYKLKSKLIDDKWKVSEYNDSEKPLFLMGEIPYEYSRNADGINLMMYKGNDKGLVIPAYINGIPVTEVSFNLLKYDYVAFPKTVNKISGTTYMNLFSMVFAAELAFTIIMFLLVLLVVNLKIGRFKNYDEYVLSGPQVVISFILFAAQIGFCIWSINKAEISWTIALIISAIIVGLYIIFIFMGEKGRKHAQVVQEKTIERTSFMNDMKLSVAHLADDISDPEVKKAVNRVVEEIRFSDPTTHDSILDLEEGMRRAVEDLKIAVSGGNKEEIMKQCEYTMNAVKDRNEKCKAYKA